MSPRNSLGQRRCHPGHARRTPRTPATTPTARTEYHRPAGGSGIHQKASLALPRSRFVELYDHQHASLRHIAATVGVSKQTVTELARDYRIPRRPQSPRKYTFDRDWLYREHVIKGRPLAELARERGVSGATMTKNAKMHNIPVRRLGRHTPDALNSDQNIPSVLKPALAGQGDGNVCNASPRSLDSLPFRPPQRTSIPTEPRSVTRSP